MRFAIALIMSIILLSGCGFSESGGPIKDSNVPAQYQVTDDYGNIITFSTKPVRICALTLSLEEVLIDLVGTERMAAVSRAADDARISLIADMAKQIPRKLPSPINIEGILGLQPDLVIVQDNMDTAFIQTLKDTGLRIYIAKVPTTVSAIRQRVLQLADVVGEKQKGEQIIQEMDRQLSCVKSIIDKIPAAEKKVVMGYSLLGVFGSQEGLFHDICVNAGVINGAALAGLTRGDHLSKEKIIETNPDIFIFPSYSSTQKGDVDALRESVIHDPALQSVKAIRNNDMIIIKDRYRYSASQYVGDAVLAIAQKSYPEHFKEGMKQ